MYNVCTIMYTHIRSQASDWNCCVKRLFVCTKRERERERKTERERERERHGGIKSEQKREIGHKERERDKRKTEA